MVNNMQRYFINKTQVSDNQIEITGSDFHHIKNVMRMKEGNQILVCDELNTYLCSINYFDNNSVFCRILEIKNENVEMPVDVTIAQGLVRREKSEEVLRRIVEIGAYGYVSVAMERSIIKLKPDKDKSDRCRSIIKEACEQSHRSRLMNYYGVINFKEFLRFASSYDLCLFAYEESGKANDLGLAANLRKFAGKSILVLVGPEGGFSTKEVELLLKNNFKAVGLGPRILRTETAPLYIMSAISYEYELRKGEL